MMHPDRQRAPEHAAGDTTGLVVTPRHTTCIVIIDIVVIARPPKGSKLTKQNAAVRANGGIDVQ
jgi:hypothetical protein